MVTTSKTASTTATTLVAEVAGPAIELVGGVLEEEQGGQVAGMCVKGQLGQLVGLVVGSVGMVGVWHPCWCNKSVSACLYAYDTTNCCHFTHIVPEPCIQAATMPPRQLCMPVDCGHHCLLCQLCPVVSDDQDTMMTVGLSLQP